MASDDAKQPLLSGSVDPKPKTTNAYVPKGRRFRRCKSAPAADFVSPYINGTALLPRSESIVGPLHPSVRQVSVYSAMYLGVGTICFYLFRDQIGGKKTNGILDSVYFCIVTMTTVGYGDLLPESTVVKLLASIFVFAGMALVSLILTKAADFLVEKQEILLVRALHMNQKVGPTDVLKDIETNGVKYKCLVALIIQFVFMLSGICFLAIVEGFDFIDAFYCVCSTMTTLGYGDKSFASAGGRMFAVVWILTSTLGLGRFFLYITELFTETRQRELVKWVLSRRMTNLDLEAADIDDDGVVDAADFIIYKLKEMGKISQEDISLVLEEFEELDVDQSGTLSASDISLAQSAKTKK